MSIWGSLIDIGVPIAGYVGDYRRKKKQARAVRHQADRDIARSKHYEELAKERAAGRGMGPGDAPFEEAGLPYRWAQQDSRRVRRHAKYDIWDWLFS